MPRDRLEAARARADAARARFGRLRPIATPQPDIDVEYDVAEPEAPVRSGIFSRYAPSVIRGVSSLVPGGPWGAAAGSLAESLAQGIELRSGQREAPSAAAIMTEGALGAIPFARTKNLLRLAGFGGAMAGGGALARQQAERGLHLPTSEELTEAGGGAILGGGAAAGFGRLLRGGGLSRPQPQVDRYLPNVSSSEAPAAVTRFPRLGAYAGGEMGMLRQTRPQSRARIKAREQASSVDEAAIAERIPGFARYSENISPSPVERAPFDLVDEVPSIQQTPMRGPLSRTPDVQSEVDELIRSMNPIPSRRFGGFSGRVGVRPLSGGRMTDIDLKNALSGMVPSEGRVFEEMGGPAAITNPARLLPAFGETAETMAGQRLGLGGSRTRVLRPDATTLQLANELAQSEIGPGARITALKQYPTPTGSDELAKALRQRAHIAEGGNRRRGLMSRLRGEEGGRLASEAGQISPELAASVAPALLGAGLGAGTDEENRLRGALLGGLAGAGVGAGLSNQKAADWLERSNFFSMLSSPLTHLTNIAGNVGSLLTESAVKALSGDPRGAGRLLAAPFTDARRTAAAAQAAYQSPSRGELNRLGVPVSGEGILSIPGRAIAAVDAASRDILSRGGLSPSRVEKAAFSNEPEYGPSQLLLQGHRRYRGVRQFVPFAKTLLNLAERGIEHSPAALFDPAIRAKLATAGTERREAIARMALGTAALGGGLMAGVENPRAIAATGPLALSTAIGGFIGAEDTPGTAADSRIERGFRRAMRMIPGVTPRIPFTQSYFASYVPNIARDIGEFLDPLERKAPGYFGETARRVPIIRETLPVDRPRTLARRREEAKSKRRRQKLVGRL